MVGRTVSVCLPRRGAAKCPGQRCRRSGSHKRGQKPLALRRQQGSLGRRHGHKIHRKLNELAFRRACARANERRASRCAPWRSAVAPVEQLDHFRGRENPHHRRSGEDESGNFLSGAAGAAGHEGGSGSQHDGDAACKGGFAPEHTAISHEFRGGCAMKRGSLLLTLFVAAFGAACGNSGSSTTPPPPVGGFSNSSLKGQYAFIMSGQAPDGFIARVGSFTADGINSITGGVEIVSTTTAGLQQLSFQQSSYQVNADGRGAINLTNLTGTFSLSVTMISTTKGYLAQTDGVTTTSGTFELQDTSAFT